MLSVGVKLVTGILFVSIKTVHVFDPVLLLELNSSEMLASEHVFVPKLFEREGKEKLSISKRMNK